MKFEKKAIFLGTKDMQMRDGTTLVTVTFYVDSNAIEVNVLATNLPVMAAVKELSFGDSCSVTFALRKSDKLYRLSLVSIA